MLKVMVDRSHDWDERTGGQTPQNYFATENFRFTYLLNDY
jgi:hypothetical protein